MGRKPTKSHPTIINARERLDTALSLRKAGLTWDEIAVRTGYANGQSARGTVMRWLERHVDERTSEFREFTVLRLEGLLNAYWDEALDGNVKAAEFCRKTIKDIAKITGVLSESEKHVHNTLINAPNIYLPEVGAKASLQQRLAALPDPEVVDGELDE